MINSHPTPDSELNAVLRQLVTSAQAILGADFTAAYLQGSFAIGDWDAHSDVDFLVVIEQELSVAQLTALQAMHAQIYALASPWAQHLDGSYFPKQALRRYNPQSAPLYYLDNGSSELVRSQHDNTLVVRWVVRERGITLAGLEPARLIDPISAADLRQEVLATMHEWGAEIADRRYVIDNRWAQPFVVLSYCRMLQTLASGRVESKPAGARWAQVALDARWRDFIQRAWVERPQPAVKIQQPADSAVVADTLRFIQYALAKAAAICTSTLGV